MLQRIKKQKMLQRNKIFKKKMRRTIWDYPKKWSSSYFYYHCCNYRILLEFSSKSFQSESSEYWAEEFANMNIPNSSSSSSVNNTSGNMDYKIREEYGLLILQNLDEEYGL